MVQINSDMTAKEKVQARAAFLKKRDALLVKQRQQLSQKTSLVMSTPGLGMATSKGKK